MLLTRVHRARTLVARACHPTLLVAWACISMLAASCAAGLPDGEATCGDGIVDVSEYCDDGNDVGGDGCDPTCELEFGYACQGEPSICAPHCGDGIRFGMEECDGEDLGGASCESLALGSGELACDPSSCDLDASGCSGSTCGNGTLDASELCEGADVGGADCVSLGFDGGSLACGSDCTFDTSGCVLLSCGNGILEGIEACDDGNATPADGCGANCMVETGWQCMGQPSVCTRLCGNGVIDASEQCDGAALSGQTCQSLGQGYVGGTLACAMNCTFNTAACELPSCGNGTLDTGEQCDGILLGGQNCATVGPYVGGTLLCLASCAYDLSGCIPITCGDGIISTGEACDDGNATGGDGCNILCHIESGWSCTGAPSVCQRTCGNSAWDSGEECDGGDLNGGTCVTEGFAGGTLGCTAICTHDTSGCTNPVCGNNTVETGEQCDDGNTTSGDGCSSTCQMESTCPTPLALGTWASGDDGWTHDTSYWVRASGYMHLDYTPGHSSSYTKGLTYSTNIDLSACSSATLSFAVRLSDDPGEWGSDRSEKLFVQCSGDAGANWTTLTPNPWPANQQSNCSSTGGYCAGGSGNDWSFPQTSQSVPLPSACLTTQARIQFLAIGSTTWSINAPGWYVYAVTIQ